MIGQAGFGEAHLAGETGFNSSPVTRGMLIAAVKPSGERKMSGDDSLKKYREFFAQAYADGALDGKMKHLVALGASLGAGCDP